MNRVAQSHSRPLTPPAHAKKKHFTLSVLELALNNSSSSDYTDKKKKDKEQYIPVMDLPITNSNLTQGPRVCLGLRVAGDVLYVAVPCAAVLPHCCAVHTHTPHPTADIDETQAAMQRILKMDQPMSDSPQVQAQCKCKCKCARVCEPVRERARVCASPVRQRARVWHPKAL